MMKKILSAALVLIMVLCCFAFAEEEVTFTGDWYCEVYGMVVTLTVNEDGTCVMTMSGEEVNTGAWEVEGETFYINRGLEDETPLAIGEGSLSYSEVNEEGEEEVVMMFTREPIETFVAPETVAATAITDFDGEWKMTIMNAFGMVIDYETAKAEMGEVMGIEDDTCVIANGVAKVFGGTEETFEFVDGMLYIASPDAENDSLAQSVRLNVDGTIVYEVMGMQIYFTK